MSWHLQDKFQNLISCPSGWEHQIEDDFTIYVPVQACPESLESSRALAYQLEQSHPGAPSSEVRAQVLGSSDPELFQLHWSFDNKKEYLTFVVRSRSEVEARYRSGGGPVKKRVIKGLPAYVLDQCNLLLSKHLSRRRKKAQSSSPEETVNP